MSEAKRAFDAEPMYQKQIAELEKDKQRLGETIAARELRIHELKRNEEVITQALRSAEVERDDAGFRALEEADKVQGLLTLVRQYVGDGLKAISAVEGQESIVISSAQHQGNITSIGLLEDANRELKDEIQQLQDNLRLAQEQLHRPFAPDTSSSGGEGMDPWSNKSTDQRVVDPTIASTPSSAEPQEVSNVSSAGSGLIEGQSDGPFVAQAQSQPESQTVGLDTAETEMSAVSSASPSERNRDRATFFKGRRYFDVTYYVPLHQWLAEGGTREDYEWKPSEFSRASHNS